VQLNARKRRAFRISKKEKDLYIWLGLIFTVPVLNLLFEILEHYWFSILLVGLLYAVYKQWVENINRVRSISLREVDNSNASRI
jgi:hypothetical protein